MNILFLTHYYPPEGNAPATRVDALARRWVAAGHRVRVVTAVPNMPSGIVYDGYRNRFWPQSEIRNGVSVLRVWTYITANAGVWKRIASYLSYMASAVLACLFLPRPDVLIATSPQFFCGWAGVLTKWLLKLRNPLARQPPFVLEIRDLWPESVRTVDAMSNPRIIRILEKFEDWMYAAADHVVTVGDGYRRKLEDAGVPAARLSVIMNGVDRDLIEGSVTDAASTRRRWGLEGKFVCSYVGTIGMAGGLDIFLRAGRRLKQLGREDIRLLAVGDGAVRADLAEQARRAGLDNVVFTGRRPKEEIAGLLAATDVCLVHLRKAELFETVMPSKIFEAFGMGRPIIIAVEGEARRLVEQSGGGVAIAPENDAALVDQLLRLEADRAKLEVMGQAGRRHVFEHFDRDRLAADYLGLLTGLASRR